MPIKVVYAGLVTYRERVDIFVGSMPFVKDYDGTVRSTLQIRAIWLRRLRS